MKKTLLLLLLVLSLQVSVFATLSFAQQPNSSAEKSTVEQEIDFRPFMKAVEKKIKAAWEPPASIIPRRTILIFTLNKQGEVTKIRVANSSRNRPYDKKAIAAVKAAAPFENFPKEYTCKDIRVHFTFEQRVHSDNKVKQPVIQEAGNIHPKEE